MMIAEHSQVNAEDLANGRPLETYNTHTLISLEDSKTLRVSGNPLEVVAALEVLAKRLRSAYYFSSGGLDRRRRPAWVDEDAADDHLARLYEKRFHGPEDAA